MLVAKERGLLWTSKLSPRMPSSRGMHTGLVAHFCYSAVTRVCSTSRTRLHRQSFPIARYHFRLLSAFFRLLWQSFQFALNFFRLLCAFSECSCSCFLLLSRFSDCSAAFSDCSVTFSIARYLFPIAQQFFFDCSSRRFRLLNKLFLC